MLLFWILGLVMSGKELTVWILGSGKELNATTIILGVLLGYFLSIILAALLVYVVWSLLGAGKLFYFLPADYQYLTYYKCVLIVVLAGLVKMLVGGRK